ncbi:HTH-type transcriptional regulator / antitoxin MqsA [Pseudomonas taetrolens]|uniref:HTH-type transcriptional regulator / antitoxin MqsA n=1 Tax=Pseudomonas taetrolens TaxID=47884 RepID=A0A0J6GMI1_PSETA|nr:type II toxin-antitoxin system MqsA family antitoxin [Pseudomonas taetrolens]KMM85921.1 XRE family transcriptional regulator [Pseudomonas taetrolens]SED05979.1 HTH-type transcriptional regulator / antitoxin MqsA [Pseudomonas taetrolens]SQF87761.1 XRE family transcriptional regulator [Pseudomonas taetrolens]VEH50952.1 XRE family transcriptional regulator [Pseudomonas taetrolens]
MSRHDCYTCGAPGAMQAFKGRSLSVSFKQLTRMVHSLAGHECTACAEIEFDAPSAERYARAGDELIEDAKRVMADEMKRIRRKLHFTQKSAVQLLSGGGHNAFSRYERAEVEPPKPLFVLMRLLDRHPELAQELQVINACDDINALLLQKEQQRLGEN